MSKRNQIMKQIYMFATVILISFLVTACDNSASIYDAPSDHTNNQDGAMHKPGKSRPIENCITCHGDDLTGGTVGVSCFECHGNKWD